MQQEKRRLCSISGLVLTVLVLTSCAGSTPKFKKLAQDYVHIAVVGFNDFEGELLPRTQRFYDAKITHGGGRCIPQLHSCSGE